MIGDAPFAVVLPDVILDDAASDLRSENMAAMVAEFNTTGISQVLVEPVPMSEVSNYGVADVNGTELKAGETAAMTKVVEKPAVDVAPSNLAIVGRYVLPAEIWGLLEKTPVGAGDEIQLTDAIDMLMEKQQVNAFHMSGVSHDCGSKLGYMQAFVEYGMRHDVLGEDFTAYIKELAKSL